MSPDQDDQIARRLEAVHEQMIVGDKRSDHEVQASEDSEFASAAGLLDFIERVRVTESACEADTPADFSTLGVPVASQEPSTAAPLGPQRIGRFEIKQQLGQGGYGLVFRAHDPQLNRDVALKVPRPEALVTEELRSRFMVEARAAAGLDHPNIVSVYDAGQAGPIYFIANRLVQGVSLARWLATRQDAVSSQSAAQLIATLAGAVEHAHRRGVVHRDLKPANILVEADSAVALDVDESQVVASAAITDFGLAKLLNDDSTGTRTGAIVGTPAYMAPEQARGSGAAVGPSADIYALGAMLYELLTRRPPFHHDSVIETIKAIQDTEPTPLRQLNAAVPRDLESICLKCLEKSPVDRYVAAEDLRVDLQRFLVGEPVLARPITALNRFAKFTKRNKMLVGSAALVAMTLVAATVTSSVFGIRASRQRDLADQRLKQSQRDAAITAEINRFLNDDLLAAADPSRSHEAGMTVREAVDRAAAKVGERFSDRPLVEATLRMTLGRTYRQLAALDAADLQYEQARQLLAKTVGDDDERRLQIDLEIARVRSQQGRYDEAETLFSAVIPALERRFGREAPETLAATIDLATVYEGMAEFEKAEAFARRAATGYEQTLGADHPSTINTTAQLCEILVNTQKLEEAERFARRAYEIGQTKHGENHYTSLVAATTLGRVLTTAGELSEAEQLLSRALEVSRRVMGESHPDAMSVLTALSDVYVQQRRWEEAARLLEQALKVRRTLGEDNPDTLQTMSRLAGLYQQLDRIDDAEPLLETVYAHRKALLGPNHPATLHDINNLAGVRYARGDYAGATVLLREAHTGMSAALGPEHPQTLAVLTNVGGLLMTQSDFIGAEAVFEQSLEAIQRVHGQRSLQTARAMSLLAEARRRRGAADEAEPLHRQALALRRELVGDNHPDVAKSVNHLAMTLDDLEKFEEAIERFQEALQILRGIYEDHSSVGNSLNGLAHATYHNGDVVESIAIFREALQMRERVHGADHPNVADTLLGLAKALNDDGKLAEGLSLAERAYAIQSGKFGDAHQGALRSLTTLARLHMDSGNWEEARDSFEMASAIVEEHEEISDRQRAIILELGNRLYGEQGLDEPEMLDRFGGQSS